MIEIRDKMEKFFINMVRPWKTIGIIIFIGLFIGSCVAIATKIFVNLILFLTDIRETATFFTTSIAGYQIN